MRISIFAATVALALSAGIATAQDTSANAGTYEVTTPDGMVIRYVIGTDGTYTASVEGQTVEAGTVRFADGQDCFTPVGEAESCYLTGEPAEDGSFTSTPVKGGETVTVRPVKD